MAGDTRRKNPKKEHFQYDIGGSMRFNPPKNWWIQDGNHQWFGLVDLINDLNFSRAVMMEIGTYAGESTSMFAASCKFLKIHTCDPWDFPHAFEMKMQFKTNTRYWDFIEHHRKYSESIVDDFPTKYFDFVYIDGDHTYESVSRDIKTWLPKIKSNGFIGGHDYRKQEWPEVVRAVNEQFDKHQIRTYRDGSWLYEL